MGINQLTTQETGHDQNKENRKSMNATSVCSPILFNIMINSFFSEVDASLGRSFYADNGTIWVRGRNTAFVERSYWQHC